MKRINKRGGKQKRASRSLEKVYRRAEALGRVDPFQTNFSYVQSLPEHQQRMAAFWEYARESIAVKNFIRLVGQNHRSKPISDSEAKITREYITGLGFDGFLLLASCYPLFPGFAFKDMLNGQFLVPRLWNNKGFGIADLICVPMNISLPLVARGWLPLEKLSVVFIPWQYSNSEITKLFAQNLEDLRPKDQPPPKRPGRKGRSGGRGAIDTLRQLAAFRLNRDGIEFDEGRKLLPHYGSIAGWRKAIQAAENRIASIPKRPFFQ